MGRFSYASPKLGGVFFMPAACEVTGRHPGRFLSLGRVDPRTTGEGSKTGNMGLVFPCFGGDFPYFYHFLGGGGLTGWNPNKKRIKK